MIILSAPLFRAGSDGPVIFATHLYGDSGRLVHGARVVLATQIDRPWGLVADHPQNEGTPVADAFCDYAQAACTPAELRCENLAWFGLGKDGLFYVWTGYGLDQIAEPRLEAGSRAAFNERLERMGLQYGSGMRTMLDSILEPFELTSLVP